MLQHPKNPHKFITEFNTTSNSKVWKGWTVWWQAKTVSTESSQMASIGAIFRSIYHTKQLNPWPNSTAVMWWITGSLFLKGQFCNLKSTWALVDFRLVRERDLSKCRLAVQLIAVLHTYHWSSDGAIKWWWKVCLETMHILLRLLLINLVTIFLWTFEEKFVYFVPWSKAWRLVSYMCR